MGIRVLHGGMTGRRDIAFQWKKIQRMNLKIRASGKYVGGNIRA
jgi:hypothetical protein